MTNHKPQRTALAPTTGLAALTQGSAPGRALDGARLLPLALIDANPAQARQVFDEVALAELAASIRSDGVLQPIMVRPIGDRYQIVIGERRHRAAGLAGLDHIPAIIKEMSDQEAAVATTLENLQRADLDIEDEARQYQYLMEVLQLSGQELARRLGKHPRYINRRVALLRRPDLLDHLRAGGMTLEAALAVLAETDRLALNTTGAPVYDTDPVVGRHDPPLDADSSASSLVERHDLDAPRPSRPPTEPGPYFRWVQQAMRSLDHIQPAIIARDERPLWAEQLTALEARIQQLRAALEE